MSIYSLVNKPHRSVGFDSQHSLFRQQFVPFGSDLVPEEGIRFPDAFNRVRAGLQGVLRYPCGIGEGESWVGPRLSEVERHRKLL